MNSLRPSRQLLQLPSPSQALCRNYVRRSWRPEPNQQRLASTLRSQPYKPRSTIRPLIWALAFGCTGFLAGKSMTLAVKLFDSIERDSDEDRMLVKAIVQSADEIPQVRELLQHEGELESDWNEISLETEEGDILVNETLRGSMGLVIPRAFWNEKERELVVAVYYGGALCGWPCIAHGGCTATVLLEGMGRALNCLTGGHQSIRPPEPSHLGLTYLKPVNAQNYYLLKAKLKSPNEPPSSDTDISADKDLAKKVHQEQGSLTALLNTKYNIECVLEDLQGKQYMKAQGVWDVL